MIDWGGILREFALRCCAHGEGDTPRHGIDHEGERAVDSVDWEVVKELSGNDLELLVT